MCGIAGFWSSPGNQREMLVLVREMTNALQHRGPDDAGQWADASSGIALGQRRLSILDLSLRACVTDPMRCAPKSPKEA